MGRYVYVFRFRRKLQVGKYGRGPYRRQRFAWTKYSAEADRDLIVSIYDTNKLTSVLICIWKKLDVGV